MTWVPAVVILRSSPSASACVFTCCEPGTTSARTPAAAHSSTADSASDSGTAMTASSTPGGSARADEFGNLHVELA